MARPVYGRYGVTWMAFLACIGFLTLLLPGTGPESVALTGPGLLLVGSGTMLNVESEAVLGGLQGAVVGLIALLFMFLLNPALSGGPVLLLFVAVFAAFFASAADWHRYLYVGLTGLFVGFVVPLLVLDAAGFTGWPILAASLLSGLFFSSFSILGYRRAIVVNSSAIGAVLVTAGLWASLGHWGGLPGLAAFAAGVKGQGNVAMFLEERARGGAR